MRRPLALMSVAALVGSGAMLVLPGAAASGSARKVPAPTSLQAHGSSQGLYLTWSGTAGDGFRVEEATNAAMTAGVHISATRGTTEQYTPIGLKVGTRYWFRVATMKAGKRSAWSRSAAATALTAAQPVRVMTYNVLEDTFDGTKENGQTVASWSAREPGVARLIEQAAPDVVGIQEAAGWVGQPHGYGGTRQIDTIVKSLPGYALARTETPPTEHYWFRTGVYLLYLNSAWKPVGKGGFWTIGASHTDNRYAAYQLLENRQTGARFLAVTTHLTGGSGGVWDDRRQIETRKLLADAAALSDEDDAPVVFAGDFNSDNSANHAFNAPARMMEAHRIADAHQAAQSLVNNRFNSANQYLRRAPAHDDSIDYVWASPTIGVISRAVVIDVRNGRFVGVMPSDHNPVLATLTVPVAR